MKFNCGLSRAEKRKIKYDKTVERLSAEAGRMREWHDYFCWLPTRIGKNDCRWLETVERKYEVADIYEYSGLWDEVFIITDGLKYRAKERP